MLYTIFCGRLVPLCRQYCGNHRYEEFISHIERCGMPIVGFVPVSDLRDSAFRSMFEGLMLDLRED